jgi:hypothetical protein
MLGFMNTEHRMATRTKINNSTTYCVTLYFVPEDGAVLGSVDALRLLLDDDPLRPRLSALVIVCTLSHC